MEYVSKYNVMYELDECFDYLQESGKINVSEKDFKYIRKYIFKTIKKMRNELYDIDTDIILRGEEE